MKTKRGRKKYPANRRRSYMLRVMLTEDERQRLTRAAVCNVSGWAREILLAAAASAA